MFYNQTAFVDTEIGRDCTHGPIYVVARIALAQQALISEESRFNPLSKTVFLGSVKR
jgi:hypothetical protein